MDREKPAELRKAMMIVEHFKKSGIGFVPMPVFNEKDRIELAEEACRRLSVIAAECKW